MFFLVLCFCAHCVSFSVAVVLCVPFYWLAGKKYICSNMELTPVFASKL